MLINFLPTKKSEAYILYDVAPGTQQQNCGGFMICSVVNGISRTHLLIELLEHFVCLAMALTDHPFERSFLANFISFVFISEPLYYTYVYYNT